MVALVYLISRLGLRPQVDDLIRNRRVGVASEASKVAFERCLVSQGPAQGADPDLVTACGQPGLDGDDVLGEAHP